MWITNYNLKKVHTPPFHEKWALHDLQCNYWNYIFQDLLKCKYSFIPHHMSNPLFFYILCLSHLGSLCHPFFWWTRFGIIPHLRQSTTASRYTHMLLAVDYCICPLWIFVHVSTEEDIWSHNFLVISDMCYTFWVNVLSHTSLTRMCL